MSLLHDLPQPAGSHFGMWLFKAPSDFKHWLCLWSKASPLHTARVLVTAGCQPALPARYVLDSVLPRQPGSIRGRKAASGSFHLALRQDIANSLGNRFASLRWEELFLLGDVHHHPSNFVKGLFRIQEVLAQESIACAQPHVTELQWQEGDEEVNQVFLHKTAVPKATVWNQEQRYMGSDLRLSPAGVEVLPHPKAWVRFDLICQLGEGCPKN